MENIILIAPAGFGGIQSWCILIGGQMQKLGFDVSIIWEQNRVQQKQNPSIPPEIKEIDFLGGSHVNQRWAVLKMAKLLKKATIVYPNTSNIGYRAISKIRRNRPIVIGGCHSMDNHDLNTIPQFEPICDAIFTLSNQMNDELKNRIPIEAHSKLNIIRHGVFVTAKKVQRSINKKIKLLVVGRLDENKQPLLALEILNKIIQKGIQAELTYVGEGTLKELLIERAKKFNLCSHIKFTGIIQKKDLDVYYQKSHFTLLLSKKEGFGLVAMEAMSFGSIPIVTNSTGVAEILLNNVNGFIVSTYNPIEEAVEKICITWNLQEKANYMAAKAQNTIINNYTILHTAKKQLEIINLAKEYPKNKNKILTKQKSGLLDCALIPNEVTYKIRKALLNRMYP